MPSTYLDQIFTQIKPLDEKAMQAAQARVDSLAKPPGSLGGLEDIAVTLAGISGDVLYDPGKRCVAIMASDNGVVEEGVASAPQEVTYAQTLNFTRGITGVAAIAKQFHADLIIVDVGINAEVEHPMILNRKIRKSTWNLAKQDAMAYEEAERAIRVGVEIAKEAADKGYKLIGAGEMGIGNTTSSAAVLCALTGMAAEQATGKGAGLVEEAYQHKVDVIRKALERSKPDGKDPIDVLAKVGGFDIAAMAGLYIGAAWQRVPIVIDGFISMVAALAASRFHPLIKAYMFASHASFERGFDHAARALGLEPCLHLHMRLGEGSGCPLMFAVIDAACAMMRDMGTFAQANIADEYVEKIRESDHFTVNE